VKTAIVTLVIGEVYASSWKAISEPGWRAYCERHGYDLMAIDQPLDSSARAKSRSPAWQKCLVLEPSIAADYERVVWVDSDLLINPTAPAVTSGVPAEKIGAVDEHSFPTADSRQRIIKGLVAYWQGVDPAVARNWRTFLDPAEWHAMAGLPKRHRHIVQTGVMVLSPQYHRDLLRSVYETYEDVGGEPMNYEMRPLSFAIQESGLAHWIDRQFNALAGFLLLYEQVVMKRPLATAWEEVALLRNAYRNNYFLHFAGRRDLLTAFERHAGPLDPMPASS
jgi:hypothetical protein